MLSSFGREEEGKVLCEPEMLGGLCRDDGKRGRQSTEIASEQDVVVDSDLDQISLLRLTSDECLRVEVARLGLVRDLIGRRQEKDNSHKSENLNDL